MRAPIVTSGIASEYTVGGLADHLRTTGWDVTEFDFAAFTDDPRPTLAAFEPGSVVYITSAHTNQTQRVAETISPITAAGYPNALAPVEFMSALRPRCSMYIPHDLLSPYADPVLGEPRFLDHYDYVLAPFNPLGLQAALGPATKVIDAGWAKYTTEHEARLRASAPRHAEPRVVVFLCNLTHMIRRHGVDGLCDYLIPLLAPGTRVKLPAWTGAEEVSARLQEQTDATVVSPDVSSIDLICDADVVICNTVSSVHAEAALLGRPCIVPIDNDLYTERQQRALLGHLPNLFFEPYTPGGPGIPTSRILEVAGQGGEPVMKAFDYEAITRLIESA